ncbi:solute carrier family 25 member 51-like [Ceratina calcarata]|uniref:Solute carrier family 25 member 51-like n=1 Tax=Ceratina calcarata TaxID=156304 RepID=A0AAJ7JF52_9HYME|nr:solute carrier family 25 member 51-like [Ceratina calcarata]XP_017892038.1 solute carrier family 25 member 51-like [Ceratina calcarata]XP_017892039.1 solute carrier family 25 member 51-like [Ceratina calcarata]XP_017892040.1 solute carrier family 25 member 51-like [Ceratina calcarata]
MSNIASSDISVKSLFTLNNNDFKEFACGWGAAVINVSITFPIHKIIFRQILEDVPANTAFRQISREGIHLLYRGILPPFCQKTFSVSVMFSTYEGCKDRLCTLTNNGILIRILAAHFAGTAEAILMPLERVQTLLQDWRYHDKFKNTSHAFKYLLKNYGISECYRGLVPIIYRNSYSNLMFFILKEQSQKLMGEQESFLTSFINGALIGGFTSTVFYPINVIKVHIQSKIGGNFEKFMSVAREIYVARNRSVVSFYNGVHLNCMRSFLSWGIINVSYDFLKRIMF